jgi:hypothetical protein
MSFGLRRKVENRLRYFSNESSRANARRNRRSRRSCSMESNFSLRPAHAVARQVSDRGNYSTAERLVGGLTEVVESLGRLRLHQTRKVHQRK